MPGDFTDLVAWQEAVGLAADVAGLVRRLAGPGAFEAASQMRRAAESVPANIAEGYGRGLGRDYAGPVRISV
jgi:four helix bundle protein